MKKSLLLLSSIITFLISLFFLIGVLVFIDTADFESTVVMGIPFIIFSVLFYTSFKKYLKLIDFQFKNLLLKWKNARFLKIIDIILSYIIFCVAFVFIEENNIIAFITSITLALVFGLLYIMKSVEKKQLTNLINKNKLVTILIHTILLILFTVLSSYYLKLRMHGNVNDYQLIIDTYDGVDTIIALVLYDLFRYIGRQGLIISTASLIYISLISYINSCLNQKRYKIILNVCSFVSFIITSFVFYKFIINSLELILLNVLILGIFIIDIMRKYKEIKCDAS